MANPSRFPAGLSTFPIQHIQNTFPVVPSQYQVTKGDDFIPFRQSTDYTATTAGTGATAAAFSWNGGALKITAGSTSTFKSFEALGANSLQFVPGNQLWHDIRLAAPTGSMGNPATDSALYTGFFDNVDPSAASNGAYFYKPAGGSAVHFIILKGGTATTFQNVADLASPSGLYSDSSAVAGTLTATQSAGAYTSIAVGTPGSGYRVAPLVIATGASGSGANAYVQLGGATQGGAISGAPLYAPYLTAIGSSYSSASFDVIPWINLQFWYDGKGTLLVGVNGRTVLRLGAGGATVVVPGATAVVSSGANSFNFNATALSTSICPVQPPAGDVFVAAPMVPLQLAFGLIGSSGNNRVMYVEEVNVGTELN